MSDATFMLEFDTPKGLDPESASTVHVLDVASSYLKFLLAIAEDQEAEFQVQGLRVIDKCVAVAAHVNSIALARDLAGRATAYIRRPDEAPRGLVTAARAVRHSLAHLPDEYRVRTIVSDWSVPVEAAPQQAPLRAWEVTSLRVTPIRIGGKSPTVRLESPSEVDVFTLAISRDLAQELAGHLYAEVEADVRLLRSAVTDEIEGGELLGFQVLSKDDPDAAWLRWAQDGQLPSADDVLAGRRED